MPYSIILDAGHGGAEPGAIYNDRREKDDTLNLTLEVGRILSEQGYDVKYTRTTDVYQTPFQKAQNANETGGDLFVSIHRNSGPEPGRYSGVETLVYDDRGTKAEIARSINQQLEQLGFPNLGVSERPNLIVLNSTQMPALLVEAGFINSEEDNERFDRQFSEIAEAIAEGIRQVVPPEGEKVLYRVQTGIFRNRQNADRMLYQLQSQGFPAYLSWENGLFYVQVGGYEELSRAIQLERQLRNNGYETFITTK